MNRSLACRVVLCVLLTLSCATEARGDYGAGRAAWEVGRYSEALKEWRRAARAGDWRAMAALGRAFAKGLGVPQDFIEAHKWFNLAAARGDAKAAEERNALEKRMTLEEQAEARKLARAWRTTGRRRSAALTPRRRAPSTLRPPRRMVRKVSPGSAALRAAAAGDISALERVLAAGANPNARGKRGWTPLMYAANKGYTLLVPPLLEAGAKPNLRAADGATALFIATLHGHSELVEILMKAGADPTIKGPKGKTAEGLMAIRVAHANYGGVMGLHKALRANERSAVIKVLLDRGADIRVRDVVLNKNSPDTKYFYTPLHIAARYNKHPGVVTLLLERGANLNEKVESQYKKKIKENINITAQALAAQGNENPKVAMFFIERGGGVNGRDADGRTPLHFAASNKNPEIARLLLDRGSDVNAKSKLSWTPVHLAASNQNPEIAKLLLDHGADVNAKANDNITPLHSAVHGKNPEVAKLLLERGADVNAKRSYLSFTPFQEAVRTKNRKIVSLFLSYERGTLVIQNGRLFKHTPDSKRKLKENKDADADPGWFDRRPDCFQDGNVFNCHEPVCDAARSMLLLSSDISEMITFLLDRDAKDFLDPRNYNEDNHQFGSRCMFRLIHRMAAKKSHIFKDDRNVKEAIENWMRRNNVDLNILKQSALSFTSGQDDDNTNNED